MPTAYVVDVVSVVAAVTIVVAVVERKTNLNAVKGCHCNIITLFAFDVLLRKKLRMKMSILLAFQSFKTFPLKSDGSCSRRVKL